jgi:hypothetical protein
VDGWNLVETGVVIRKKGGYEGGRRGVGNERMDWKMPYDSMEFVVPAFNSSGIKMPRKTSRSKKWFMMYIC